MQLKINSWSHLTLGAQKYQCPNDKNGQYEDEVQCDKYYECKDGIAKEKLCPDGLVFDPSLRKVNKCDQPFNVDCGDRTELRKCSNISWSSSATLFRFHQQRHQREEMISAQERTASSPIPTQPFAKFSTLALMENTLRTSAQVDSTSTNTLELACGPKTQTAKDALKPRKNWKTDSNARKTRARTTSQVKSSPIHISHTQKIVRSSTFASTVLNHVNLDALLEKSSMTKLNVATHQKMFPDGKFMTGSCWMMWHWWTIILNLFTARTGTKMLLVPRTKKWSFLNFFSTFDFSFPTADFPFHNLSLN